MKHATLCLALLAGAAGSVGCGHCDPSELLVYWTFQTASGQATTSCSAAGVTTIRVFVDGQAQTDFFTGTQDLGCADYDAAGGIIVPIRGGGHTVQIDAFDANGTLAYQASPAANAVNVGSCGATTVDVAVLAVQGSLTFNLSGFTQCPANSFVWYSLRDVATNTQVDVVNGLHTPQALQCNGTVPVLSSLGFGTFRIDFVEVVSPDVNGTFVPRFTNCTPQQFNHAADDTLSVTLSAANGFCPGS